MSSINFDSITIDEIDRDFGFLSCERQQSEFLQAAFMVLAKLCKKTCIPKWQAGHVPSFKEVKEWVTFWNAQNNYYEDPNFPNGSLSITKEDIWNGFMIYDPQMEITFKDFCDRTVKVFFTEKSCRISWEDGTWTISRILDQFEDLLHLVTAWDAWDKAD
jgi:hypothetical protein